MGKAPRPVKSISFNDRSVSKVEKGALLNKSSSFSPPHRSSSSINPVWNLTTDKSDGRDQDNVVTLSQVSEEIDGLIEKLSTENISDLPEIPEIVEKFTKMVQLEIDKYDSGESPFNFGDDIDQDTMVVDGVNQLSKLFNLLTKFSPTKKATRFLSLITLVVQHAMNFMEEELRIILEDAMNPSSVSKTPKSAKHPSTSVTDAIDSEDPKKDEEEKDENTYPGISENKIFNMRRIMDVMISAGYETECCQVYNILRRNAFKEAIKLHGFDKISIDEVQRMPWEALEGHIGSWIKVVKYAADVLLRGEKRLCDSVFADAYPLISEAMFSNLIQSAVILFLNFAEAIGMTKRSAERLFKVLDIYDTLSELMAALDDLCSEKCANELKSELSSVRRRLGEAAISIFCDLENSIKIDVARNPVPGGAVHPLTKYTMNYLRYTCDFKETLEQVFSLRHVTDQHLEALEENNSNNNEHQNEESGPKHTPFAAELISIMDLLDANLETKSKLYKDPSLRFIFLMNNERYIHKSYQRETWSRVLQCLNQEGLQVNGKIQKLVLKERFKCFNQMFEEIHKTQSSWVVSDEQLRSELRVSISAVMIPAYRSFMARFGQHFTPGRQSEKYIKFQPDDIETTIEGLFEGKQNLSMARRKT